MSCRCGDIRDCERDLHTLRLAHGDAERLGIRLRQLAERGREGSWQNSRAYPLEAGLRERMRQKTEQFCDRTELAQRNYLRYLEYRISEAEEELACMQDEDDAYHEDDED